MTSPPTRTEAYTTQQPDGTFVTHTTTVREKIVEDTELTFGGGQINERYCCKPEGILRIVEIGFYGSIAIGKNDFLPKFEGFEILTG
uniref:Uncharacterized protein n=1 Tax=Panagrolaimus sp. JU765 TaxID=591449 RepID=A0AC34R1V1_9BILA